MRDERGTRPVIIANCSGFYGDRISAAKEMVEGGPIDVLTGDWLAELTMLILAKDRMKDPNGGYARTFLKQMQQVMATCLERGIKVVANAGGLNPKGLAEALEALASELGLSPTIAYVAGDDLMPQLDAIKGSGNQLLNLDTAEPLGDRPVLTANAYLGGWGIVEALERGADIVVTGRTTDAALIVGPAAWWHGWGREDWDQLAGAVVAGHVIECGTQATGGNYSGFLADFPDLDDLIHPGFPIAEIAADGSSVITKHEGHAGGVTEGTVTAQLLYEIAGPRYLNPDVTTRFDSIELKQIAKDRVGISGVRGEAPPSTTKVCINLFGATKASFTFLLAGLDIEAKADLLLRGLWAVLPNGRDNYDHVETQLLRTDHEDPARNELANAQLVVTFKDADPTKFGKPIQKAMTELALATYPGFFGGPSSSPQAYGVYWPTLVPNELITHEVVVGGESTFVEPTKVADGAAIESIEPLEEASFAARPASGSAPGGPTERTAIGRLVGARSGDKGGNANLGVWARTDAAWLWLQDFLTAERLTELLPETAGLEVQRYELGNLRALNFVIVGLLGEGVASSTRTDPQAKSLGEYLRAKLVDVPVSLLQ